MNFKSWRVTKLTFKASLYNTMRIGEILFSEGNANA